MASEWETVELGTVAAVVMGQSPPGSTYNETRDGLPFFQGVKDFGCRHPSVRVYCSAPSRLAHPGDILFSVRAPIGRVNVAVEECAFGRGLAVIRPHAAVDARYLEFALRYIEEAWSALEGGGSVFGNATRGDLESLTIPWPPESVQREAIAHILGTLDDKIELNRRMARTLEEMARALFRAWFVDFEPVRAKMDGRWRPGESLPGLPAHLYHLFPDRLVDSELGPIPEGWEVRSLGNVMELAYGKALKAEDRRPGSVPVYGSNGQVGWHDESLVGGPGIVVGRKGNPWTSTWVATDFFPIDTAFYVVPKQDCLPLEFLLLAIERHDLASLGADSAVPGLNRNLAYMSNQLRPTGRILLQFAQCVGQILRSVHQKDEESRTLAALRDTLLPKLISGEIRVIDGEHAVEEAGIC